MIKRIEIEVLDSGYCVTIEQDNGLDKTMAFERWFSLSMEIDKILKDSEND